MEEQLVAVQDAAHQPRRDATAAVHHGRHAGAGGRGAEQGLDRHRLAGLAVAHHVRVGIGQERERARRERDTLAAVERDPAVPLRHHVQEHQPARAGQQPAGELCGRRGLDRPRRREVAAEQHRAGETHDAQQVGEHVDRRRSGQLFWRPDHCRGPSSLPILRPGPRPPR